MDKFDYLAIAAFGAAFIITLVLAAFLTPASWWKRPNVRALSVMVLGTWAIGSLLTGLDHAPARAGTAVASAQGSSRQEGSRQGDSTSGTTPVSGAAYRVHDDLNIRAGKGIAARRVGVVPAGAVVTATGVRDGDWWQVRLVVDGKAVEGWSSSLWLRRADE